eukprot:Polyplicarium_translucidae@DN2784_c0_g1_i3.p1
MLILETGLRSAGVVFACGICFAMRFAAAAVTAKEDFQPQDENPGAAILCASRLEDLASHFGVATIELCEEDEAVWDQVGQSAGSCVGRALRILRSCEGSLPNDVFTEAFNGPPCHATREGGRTPNTDVAFWRVATRRGNLRDLA